MKNKVLAIVIFIGNIHFCNAQVSDFRGFSWSNSINQIQAGEKAPLVKKVNDDELVYKDRLGSSDCDIVFIFNDNDKLESGMYVFTKKYSNPQLYVQDYTKFKNLLSEKYGNPVTEKESWNNSTTIDEKHNYGQAVADGNLQLNAVWDTDRTMIKITLITIYKQPNLQIHYTARSLDELENKDDLKSAMMKL